MCKSSLAESFISSFVDFDYAGNSFKLSLFCLVNVLLIKTCWNMLFVDLIKELELVKSVATQKLSSVDQSLKLHENELEIEAKPLENGRFASKPFDFHSKTTKSSSINC
jgi:hypothetical protein